MLVQCTLAMIDVIVDNTHYDEIEITWLQTMSDEELYTASQAWFCEAGFLSRRMTGLQRVGDSSLTFNPQTNITA